MPYIIIYPACCRPFWENSRGTILKSPPQLRGMEIIRLAGYVYEEKLAIANQYLIPQTIATWWAIFRNCFFFFRRDIFAGWQRIKWFSERGWWVCLVSRTSILMDTWSHTHSFHIVINYPIYIYIYIYTLYNKVALVVSDLLQDEKKTSWYVIIVDFFQANNGVAKDMLDLQPEVVCRHGCHWWWFWNLVCRCKESPPLIMNVCVGAAETLERVGKYSSSLFWYFTGRRDLYHPSLSTVTVFGQDPPYGHVWSIWRRVIFWLRCLIYGLYLFQSRVWLKQYVYIYIHLIILITLTFKYICLNHLYLFIYIDICIYMFSYVFSYVWRRYYFILLLLLGLFTPLWGSSLKYGTFHSQWVLWLILARKTR